MKSQFKTMRRADTKQPYDVDSIMHYGGWGFAAPGKLTMTVNPGTTGSAGGKMSGNRQELSPQDADQLNDWYCGGAGGSGGGGGDSRPRPSPRPSPSPRPRPRPPPP